MIVFLVRTRPARRDKKGEPDMKLLRIAAVILVAVLCLSFISGCDPVKGVVELSPDSFYDRMIIKDGKVYMLCRLEFVNNSRFDLSADVIAASAEDAENGLLKDRSLSLYIISANSLSDVNEENIEELLEPADGIRISGHGTVRYLACFVGEHGGGMEKHDRELPDNIIIDARPR